MTFADLKFESDEMTEHAHHFFDNHYGISVIRGPYSHGGRQGLYELAVLYMAPEDKYSELVYDTPVTSDVEGHLTPDDVTRLMEQVSQLPPRQLKGSDILRIPEHVDKLLINAPFSLPKGEQL